MSVPSPPCGLSRQEVMALRPDVPLNDGDCQNKYVDGAGNRHIPDYIIV
jgi:hypothetical protein